MKRAILHRIAPGLLLQLVALFSLGHLIAMVEPVIDSQVIGSLLPHSGEMCLLDAVIRWNEESIEARAISHTDSTNPLVVNGRLPVHAALEYAAQAMAVHGTLCEQRAGRPRAGYLAVVSNVDWFCDYLDSCAEPLQVMARKLAASSGGFNYAFSVTHTGDVLIAGNAVVALQDSKA